MQRNLFGTDGIRGVANSYPITAELMLRVAMAAGRVLHRGAHRHLVVIGKDTRLSGYMLEPALTAGFTSMGIDVVLLGPMPTPAVAMLTRSLRADLGVVISASHNPFEDNGIKLFGADGFKLSEQVETEIARIALYDAVTSRASPAELGHAARLADAPGRYIEFVKASLPRGRRFDGLKIVVDCANGAAYKVAPTVLYELGAEVIPLGVEPNGMNINHDCGTTAPAALQREVVTRSADLGIALDGDADRLMVCDNNGRLIDGDQILALLAARWRAQGELAGAVVSTILSNLALERHLGSLGIPLTRTAVGDRCVAERMRAIGANLGGEPCGHIILGHYSTTGDGLLAALQFIAAIQDDGRPVSESGRVFVPLPQMHRNVPFTGKNPLDHNHVKIAISSAQRQLGGSGRMVVRKSGTEPVIRVMAEAEDEDLVRRLVDAVTDAVASCAQTARVA